MGLWNVSNLKKTISYCKKNGIRAAFYTAAERIGSSKKQETEYQVPSENILEKQRKDVFTDPVRYSILVPCYETREKYLREMIQSVLAQTYGSWQLILADASETDHVEQIVSGYSDDRIVYLRLDGNKGISENTNEAIKKAEGDYTVLLDHDDLLTVDALYTMSDAIRNAEVRQNGRPLFLYSDEDKTDENTDHFFTPHRKPDFNFDLLLTNNYICHLLVVQTQAAKRLLWKKEYDGAQDYDFVLRLTEYALQEYRLNPAELSKMIVHVPSILYHWRCHSGSTADNPESKMYAYEAGLRAVMDYAVRRGWNVCVTHAEHLGFYRVTEECDDFWRDRTEIAAIGGPIISHGKIRGGAMSASGKVFFQGISRHFSGYMNRAVCRQDVEALDIRNMLIRRKYAEEFISNPRIGDLSTLQNMHEVRFDDIILEPTEWEGIVRLELNHSKKAVAVSLLLSEYIRECGGLLLYDPSMTESKTV